jgi:hypothetical protein
MIPEPMKPSLRTAGPEMIQDEIPSGKPGQWLILLIPEEKARKYKIRSSSEGRAGAPLWRMGEKKRETRQNGTPGQRVLC